MTDTRRGKLENGCRNTLERRVSKPTHSPGRPVLPAAINSDQFGMEVAAACRFGRRVDQTSVQAREVQREIVVGIERAPLER